ncbi:MAG: hypothetical protein WCG91_04375 [Candidatus Shapirobacteria bacterium]
MYESKKHSNFKENVKKSEEGAKIGLHVYKIKAIAEYGCPNPECSCFSYYIICKNQEKQYVICKECGTEFFTFVHRVEGLT